MANLEYIYRNRERSLFLRRLSFLLWVVKTYNSNKLCFYINEEGDKVFIYKIDDFYSPIGRHLGEHICYKWNNVNESNIQNLWTVFRNDIPVWMRDLGINFMRKIQEFHDNEFNWNERGLTEQGKFYFCQFVTNILTQNQEENPLKL